MPSRSPAVLFGVAVFAAALVALCVSTPHFDIFNTNHDQWLEAVAQCQQRYTLPDRLVPAERTHNPRVAVHDDASPKLIKNALILDGDGHLKSTLHDIFITNGLITHIAESHSEQALALQNIFTTTSLEVIDAKGNVVSPGLVEMHSHMGICTQPELKGVNDMFELMSPATPFTRVIDAFNIGDPAIQLNSYGGVTTSLVLPSANLISGEGYVMKMFVPESRSVEEMLVSFDPESEAVSPNTGKRHRYMKMACGENPKKRYVSRPEAPKSRMGLGYLFRKYMDRATALKEEQDQWCAIVEKKQVPDSPFPHEVEIEILVGLLRGQVLSNAHCYETFDIETLLRHSREFKFEVNALHHALDAYRIPKMLKDLPYNITIATFATLWGFKKEANQASLFSPGILESHDINVVLTTDHPALPGHTLIYQAQIAHNYGLSAEAAFASVTGSSAKALNIDDRLGYLREGYDADLVIWDKHPLQAGATPLKVFIDGEKVLNLPLDDKKKDAPQADELAPESRYTAESLELDQPDVEKEDFLIKGIRASFVDTFDVRGKKHFELLVIDGEVSCFASSCPSPKKDITVIELENGHIMPGFAALSEAHGLVDIDSEHSTGDGDVREQQGTSFKNPESILYSRDGLHLGSEHIVRALNSGVTRIITPPFRSEGKKFITGVSAAFKSNTLDPTDILKEIVALHVTFGEAGKELELPTVSSQIAALRRLLVENKSEENAYGLVARGLLPLAVHVNSRDIILQLLRLQKELAFRMVIVGGLESHLVTDQLVAQKVPVIVKGWRCQRKFWDERRCLVGVGGEQTILANLTSAGVNVGLAYPEDQDIRLALDQLASAAKASGLSQAEAIGMVTTNVMSILGVEDSASSSFIVVEGSPVEFGSKVAAVVEDGMLIREFPQPEPVFDPYR